MKTSLTKMPYKIPPPPTLRPSLPSISSNTLSLGRTIAEGFAFGTGSSIARKILDNNDSSSAKPGIELEVSEKAPTISYSGGNGNNGDNDELCKAIRNQMVSCKNRDMYDALNTFYKELCID